MSCGFLKANSEIFLKKVIPSCEYLHKNCQDVKIAENKLEEFVEAYFISNELKNSADANLFDFTKSFIKDLKTNGCFFNLSNFPLKFPNFEAEINFLILSCLLEFGSGFRKELHENTQQGAHLQVTFGLISMHLSRVTFDEGFFQNVTNSAIFDYFHIPEFLEKNVNKDENLLPSKIFTEIKFVQSPLEPFVSKITQILRESGQTLSRLRCKDFSEYLCKVLKSFEGPVEKKFTPAEWLVDNFARDFRGFRDVSKFEEQEIYILKKVQLLFCKIQSKVEFLHKETQKNPHSLLDLQKSPLWNECLRCNLNCFHSCAVSSLTIFADNVIPAMLEHFGILVYSSRLKQRIDAGFELFSHEKFDLQIRAASILAVHRIVSKLSSEKVGQVDFWSDSILDSFFWKMGKLNAFRTLPRHQTKDTIYY